MRRLFASWIVAFPGAFALVTNAQPAYAQGGPAREGGIDGPIAPVAVTGVTVIDIETGAPRTAVTVLTEGDRIAAIGPKVAIPRGAIHVSGKGKFLIPGLWDMHTHHQATGAECLDLFVAKGVAGTRDM